MFGIGYQEMFIILVVALVVFGPSRLPELAGQVGRWVRDFRRMSADLTGEFEKTFAEVDEVKKSFQREMNSIQAEVEGVGKSARGDLKKAAAGKRSSGSALKAGSGSGSGASARAAASGKAAKSAAANGAKSAASKRAKAAISANGPDPRPTATKSDPLVDVSFFDLDAEIAVASNGAATGNGAVSPEVEDALSRVRARRATSTYGRRPGV
jgi:Tat protein translocase TatB subunit